MGGDRLFPLFDLENEMKLVKFALLTLTTLMITACKKELGATTQPENYARGECYYDIERKEQVCKPDQKTHQCPNDTTPGQIGETELCINIYKQNTCLLNKNGFEQALNHPSSELFESCLIFENQNHDNDELLSSPLQIIFGSENKQLKKRFRKVGRPKYKFFS